MSGRSALSEWVLTETRFALDAKNKLGSPRIIPVFIDESVTPSALRNLVSDMLGFRFEPERPFEEAFDILWKSLTSTLRREIDSRIRDDRPRFQVVKLASFVHGFEFLVSGTEPTWANRADEVAFVRQAELHVADGRGTSSEVVAEMSPIARESEAFWSSDQASESLRLFSPTASHDGRYVAFWQASVIDEKATVVEADLVVWDRVRGNEVYRTLCRVWITSGYVDLARRAWSPVRSELVYAKPAESAGIPVVVEFADGQVFPRECSNGAEFEAAGEANFSWAPDGNRLVIASGGGGVYRSRIYDRSLTAQGDPRFQVGSHVRWLDDEIIMVSGGAGQYELATFNPTTMRRKRVLSATNEYRYFDVSPDRKMIAYWESVHGGYELRIHELESDTIAVIARVRENSAEIQAPEPRPPAWHPSSKRVVVGIDDHIVVLEVPF
jgi:Tol biopolymer transport system component